MVLVLMLVLMARDVPRLRASLRFAGRSLREPGWVRALAVLGRLAWVRLQLLKRPALGVVVVMVAIVVVVVVVRVLSRRGAVALEKVGFVS